MELLKYRDAVEAALGIAAFFTLGSLGSGRVFQQVSISTMIYLQSTAAKHSVVLLLVVTICLPAEGLLWEEVMLKRS